MLHFSERDFQYASVLPDWVLKTKFGSFQYFGYFLFLFRFSGPFFDISQPF